MKQVPKKSRRDALKFGLGASSFLAAASVSTISKSVESDQIKKPIFSVAAPSIPIIDSKRIFKPWESSWRSGNRCIIGNFTFVK